MAAARETPKKVLSTLALPVAAAAVALAAAFAGCRSLFSPEQQTVIDSQTYCYEGVQTLSDDQPASARCFTVIDGRFTDVFTPDVETDIPNTLPGYVIPGLWDGHGHLIQYGEFLQSVDLFGSSALDDVRRRLRDYVGAHPTAGSQDQWLRGFGWDQMALGGMPTARDLDSDNLEGLYVMLDRIDGHCIWVSQAVLDLLPAMIPDVPGGEVIRQPGLGVFCDNAMDMIMALWPRPGPAVKADYIQTAMRKLNTLGLVGMHDAGVVPKDLQLYRQLAGTDAWTVRVHAMIECAERNTFCADDVAALTTTKSDTLSIRSVKLFADGALGSWGSAMLEPYSDRPDMSGSLLVNGSTLQSLARQWAAAGFQVNIHAIGDRANRYAIDAFEAALVDLCPARPPAECQHEHRFRIEHAQIIHPHDQARLHALALLPSIQPTHATSDMAYAEKRLGAQRTREEAYRMKTLLRNRPILGSDFPIEPPDPFQGMYAAVARRSPHTGKSADGTQEPWHGEEALTRTEALVGFTKGPAYGAFWEGQAGVIQRGAFADWVVLDRQLEDYDLEAFRDFHVRETWMGGKKVYKRTGGQE